jgi:hypothetical protein
VQKKKQPQKKQPSSQKKELVVLKAPDADLYASIKIRDAKDYVNKKITLKGWIAQIRGCRWWRRRRWWRVVRRC